MVGESEGGLRGGESVRGRGEGKIMREKDS